ncbi:hypothetical protein Acsp03_56540 [Actinomadura sp. NBRC 104412]|uniref:hypothetical protein n=1 Tax=unclassified Actinomadura TaxID=2626254 RepID=UPI0024A4218B|nr:hypothetical protein [Actinomadura sp. NBRC 104412]GLZ08188.1 hypothetical protein Acsp03_56540 [Actinomadura sp. NBRC 104412]
MAHQGDSELPGYEAVGDRLTEEFAAVHAAETVARCVAAARHGAQEVTGGAPPDLVERIARKHLQVLAIVAAEKRRHASRPSRGTPQ